MPGVAGPAGNSEQALGPMRVRRSDRGTERLTLGLVTANIHLGVGATLWSGVLAAAERNDVNLVCLPGSPLRPGGAPRNELYELIGPERLDGVVCWTSTLGLPAARDQARRLTQRLGELPVISLNRDLDGHETLLLDSHAGMRDAVRHLVDTHGRRRLACIRGPLANPVSLDRYRAYTRALSRHRLPYDHTLVSASVDFASGAGASAMRVLLDVRGLRPGLDFDAVVACSDVLAADALRFLNGRGVRVPEEVSVISFNDSLEARLSDPPLTSVALPFAELGALAVDTLVARLRGTRPPARSAVAGTLVTRRSCGCHSPLVAQGAPDTADEVDGGAPMDETFAMLPASGPQLASAFRADLGVLGDLGDLGVGPNAAESPPACGAFLDLLERVIGGRVHTFADASAWARSLLRLRGLVVPGLPLTARPLAERLLGQARLMVADKSQRLLEHERWAEEQESRRLRELGTTLTTAVDIDALTDALARHLPGTGVSACHLVLYQDGRHHTEGGGRGRVRLVPPRHGAVADATADHPAHDVPYPAALLLPDEHLPRDRRFTFVAEPLHIGDEQLGFALFETGDPQGAAHRGALFRALGDQLSAALKGIRLFDEVRHARDAAEQANRLKTRLLDNATDELRTPVEAILRHTRTTDAAGDTDRAQTALRLAHQDADRLLRLIDDLLDLSRSEIDALDLSRRLLDPHPLLTDAFRAAARARPGGAEWRLRLPRRLPAIRADGPRLRQIILNLLAAASGHSAGQSLLLTAEVRPPLLSLRIACPDLDVPPGEAEHLFQPFASGEPGMRLGLAIARRLAVLHGGSVTLDRAFHDADGDADGGLRGFHLVLPLPTPAEPPGLSSDSPEPSEEGTGAPDGTVLVAATADPPCEVAALARRQGLQLHRLHPDDEIAVLATGGRAAVAVAWDVTDSRPQEWSTIRRLHDHPALRRTPFLLYGPAAGTDLDQALDALRPPGLASPAVVVDAHAPSRERLRRLLTEVLPGREVRTAADGTAALALLTEDAPCLLIVSRTLPDMDGFDVVDRLSDGTGNACVPVLLVSDGGFTFEDVRRAEPHPGIVLLGRDILDGTETAALLTTMLERTEPGAHRTSAPVRHALAYIEQHYRHRFSRWQVAQSAGVSEDHLSRLFHREFGLTLWEYLTRLRILRAKERLRQSDDSVQAVARAVGFHDRAYFSRVFRKLTGVAPHAYREAS